MIKNLLQAYINGLKNIFKLKWRMPKYGFCCFMTVHCLVCLLLFIGFYFFARDVLVIKVGETILHELPCLGLRRLLLLIIIPYLAIGHRLQDMGKSGFNLLSYIIVFGICYVICMVLLSYCWKFIVPNPHFKTIMESALWKVNRISYIQRYAERYAEYLSCFVFLFFAYRWIFPDGDKKANAFGKAVKQSEVSKWFTIVPLLFVSYVISYPLIFILEFILNMPG